MAEQAAERHQPTPDEIYSRGRERYLDDADFRAKVKLTAKLIGVEPVGALCSALHAAELAADLLKINRDLHRGLQVHELEVKTDG